MLNYIYEWKNSQEKKIGDLPPHFNSFFGKILLMYNWNTDTTQFKNARRRKIWTLIQQLDYGSNEDVISKKIFSNIGLISKAK